MRNLTQLRKQQTQRFIKAQRSRSLSKLYANDLLKLKKPLFNDYLLHLKLFAGSPPKIKQKPQSKSIPISKQQLQQQFDRIKAKNAQAKKDTTVSHYYCEKNELLSLKEFIILMEESKKRSEREHKHSERLFEKKMAEQLNKNMQAESDNYVDLRLTSSYAKKYKERQNFRIMPNISEHRKTFNEGMHKKNLWNNSALRTNMTKSHTNFQSLQKKPY